MSWTKIQAGVCMQGEADVSAWVAKRVDMLLQQTARLGLRSKAACISYLGASFRTPLQLSETKSDYAVSLPATRNLILGCCQLSASPTAAIPSPEHCKYYIVQHSV